MIDVNSYVATVSAVGVNPDCSVLYIRSRIFIIIYEFSVKRREIPSEIRIRIYGPGRAHDPHNSRTTDGVVSFYYCHYIRLCACALPAVRAP